MSIELNSVIQQKMQTHAQEQYIQYVIDYLDRNMGDAVEFFGEAALRKTIEVGRERANVYGIVNQRDLCLYVYVMCTSMGSFFDEDPLYPWVRTILNDQNYGPSQNIERLITKITEWSRDLTDKEFLSVNEEQLNVIQSGVFFELFSHNEPFDYVKYKIQSLSSYQKKQINPDLYKQFEKKNILLSKKYGIEEKSNQACITGLSFFIGYAFFVDPKYLKIKNIFLNNQLSENQKMIELQVDIKEKLILETKKLERSV